MWILCTVVLCTAYYSEDLENSKLALFWKCLLKIMQFIFLKPIILWRPGSIKRKWIFTIRGKRNSKIEKMLKTTDQFLAIFEECWQKLRQQSVKNTKCISKRLTDNLWVFDFELPTAVCRHLKGQVRTIFAASWHALGDAVSWEAANCEQKRCILTNCQLCTYRGLRDTDFSARNLESAAQLGGPLISCRQEA